MFNFLKKISKKHQNNNDIKDIIPDYIPCPKCEGKIQEKEDYWICENTEINKCNIKVKNIYKEQKLNIKYLLDFKNTVQYRYLKQAIIDAKKEKALRDEIKALNTPILEAHCYTCISYVYRKDDKIVCGGCDFTIPTSYKGVDFSDEEMSDLIDRRISEEHTFYDENNKPFKGRVALNINKNHKEYIFFKDIDDLYESNILNENICDLYYQPKSMSKKFVSIKYACKKARV